MARSLSAANRFVSALSSTRRALSSSSAAARLAVAEEKPAAEAVTKKMTTDGSVEVSPWVPDPVTGYYRPANSVGGVDPAELRESLLSGRARNS